MILVDKPFTARGRTWCHMISDTSLEELHAFAASIGLKRAWFQPRRDHPHYDLTGAKIDLAIRAGAQRVGRVEFLAAIRKNRERKQTK